MSKMNYTYSFNKYSVHNSFSASLSASSRRSLNAKEVTSLLPIAPTTAHFMKFYCVYWHCSYCGCRRVCVCVWTMQFIGGFFPTSFRIIWMQRESTALNKWAPLHKSQTANERHQLHQQKNGAQKKNTAHQRQNHTTKASARSNGTQRHAETTDNLFVAS